jgi:hypothetical protein
MFQRASVAAAASAFTLGTLSFFAQPASANLVTNGTFDTGLGGWTLVASDIFTGWNGGFGNPPGSFQNGNVGSIPATLSQAISTMAGSLYNISFDLYHNDPGVGDTFSVSFGGVNLIGPGPIPQTNGLWQTFTFNNILATGSSSTFSVVGYDNPSYFYVDNVKVTPGPLPAVGAAAAFGFSRRLRQRIKRAKVC